MNKPLKLDPGSNLRIDCLLNLRFLLPVTAEVFEPAKNIIVLLNFFIICHRIINI